MAKHYKTYIDGEWISTDKTLNVTNKFSGEIFATVPLCTAEQTTVAVDAAAAAFATFRKFPAHKRSAILERTAELLMERIDEVASVICQEVGKAWKFSINEVQRSVETFKFAAEEAKRLHGETIPVDASIFGENRFGYYIKEAIGVVGAITPFNFPLNLVAHKVAPAVAVGNTVVLKPASTTPVSALLLAEIMEEAGLPKGVFNVVIGSGATVGDAIVLNKKCKKITFTGSPAVGEQIIKKAGIKKTTLELGNNSATMIEPDADLEKAAARCVVSAFSNSGQVCISLQRLFVHRDCLEKFTELFVAKTKELKIGDPLDKDTDIGPMIDLNEIERIDQWVKDAVAQGAKVACGGKAQGRIYQPTVLTQVTHDMNVVCMETFAPIVSLVPYDDFSATLELINSSDYGLQAGIYTNNINKALQAVEDLEVGGVMINDTATYRVDHLPYGGNKLSGLGREGIRFAMDEMTNIKMVMINRN
jgi:acyl-CoA reductase-like NAD-dependent aldehyde dehydrogenase